MTVARSVANVLCEQLVVQVDCIDRIYCNEYVPGLQYPEGLVGYVHRQVRLPIASTAPPARITDAFDAAVHRFAHDNAVPWVDFMKKPYRGRRRRRGPRTWPSSSAPRGCFRGPGTGEDRGVPHRERRDANGDSYPSIVKTTGPVDRFYFYCYDDDFGPFFLKFCSYFPYNAKLCINSNRWAQRQAAKAGIAFEPFDNGFAAVDDPAALQAICDSLGPAQIDALLREWLAILPHPSPPLTAPPATARHLDPAGRVIPDPDARPAGVGAGLLRAGHPRRPRHRPARPVGLIFDRRIVDGRRHQSPGRFPPGSSPAGSPPACTWTTSAPRSSRSHQEGRALRTKTTINGTPPISGSGTADHLPALRGSAPPATGIFARTTAQPRPVAGTDALAAVTGTHHRHRRPLTRAAVHRPAKPRAALRAAPVPPTPERVHQQRPARASPSCADSPPTAFPPASRLRPAAPEARALIAQVPHSHRCTVTDEGLDTAKTLACVHDRVLRNSLAELATPTPTPGPLRCPPTAYRPAIDTLAAGARLAA